MEVFILIWLGIGLVSCIFIIFNEWRRGYDLTFIDLVYQIFLILLGPILTFIYIQHLIPGCFDKIWRKTILHGKTHESKYLNESD